MGRLQTISETSFFGSGTPTGTQEGLLSLLYLEEVTEKIKDLLVADELIARTRLEWMDAHQAPENCELTDR